MPKWAESRLLSAPGCQAGEVMTPDSDQLAKSDAPGRPRRLLGRRGIVLGVAGLVFGLFLLYRAK